MVFWILNVPTALPEDVYNDVIPSGIHNYNRNELFKAA